ncbi:ricin-type beta-trefoil lectin domain protein [Streptomyces montanisoli]|uniref:ricin-type beta-trefoil lectin domain protein n=1 Tax=Streptomyces montanisoli TaxID=2798581 RepID=UPI0027DCE318|nr:ricin-type beta-trefoil lectin domain protein [Streptomyces montanisoli]
MDRHTGRRPRRPRRPRRLGAVIDPLHGRPGSEHRRRDTRTDLDLQRHPGPAVVPGADDSIRALGKCLDVKAAGTANNTEVQLYECNGTGAQSWQQQANGAFLNPASGRCLDVPAASTDPGTQLQIYDCNGTAAQTWSLQR